MENRLKTYRARSNSNVLSSSHSINNDDNRSRGDLISNNRISNRPNDHIDRSRQIPLNNRSNNRRNGRINNHRPNNNSLYDYRRALLLNPTRTASPH